jgi:hypothetical protein
MTIILDGTTGITTPTTSTTGEFVTSVTGFKNRIINGAMVIDQRNAGASVTPTSGQYTLDRYKFDLTQTSKITTQQNAGAVTLPVGFSNYLGITSSSAYAVLAGDYFLFSQSIEGFNFADMAWGTANAKTITLSFQVYSSLTGTFGGSLNNSAQSRSYPFTYTISVANTWTTISVTIAGDTTGTWIGATSGIGLRIYWNLGTGTTFSGTAGAWAAATYLSATGATSVVGTNGATFYITGVQLEKGSTATSFDYRSYPTELGMCQRYYEKLPAGMYGAVGVRTTDWYGNVMWQVEKRTNATCTLNGTINIIGSVGDINTQTPTGIDTASTKSVRIYRNGSSFTTQAGSFYIPNYLEVSAEL